MKKNIYIIMSEAEISELEALLENTECEIPEGISTENIAAKDTLTASSNIREGWSDHGVTFENGTFTASQLGNWERSAMVLSNKYLNAETVIKDGQEIAASAATTYITATLNYSATTDSKTAGVLFGKFVKLSALRTIYCEKSVDALLT